MSDKASGDGKKSAHVVDAGKHSDGGADHHGLSVNDVDMKSFKQAQGPQQLEPGFNYIDNRTSDRLADKDGFVTKDALQKAIKDPKLDDVQKDDIKHMLNNFALLAGQVNDKDGGKRGISKADVAKYDFPIDFNYIESPALKQLTKTADGFITKDAISDALKRSNLTSVERDDIEYLQRQYANIKGLSKDGANEGKGISMADVKASNDRIDRYFPKSDFGDKPVKPKDN